MRVEYRLLGPLEAVVDGQRAALAPRERGVLAALALRSNRVVSAFHVIDAVWPEDPPDSAVNLVQGYVSNLRRKLGRESIETREPGYLLRVDDDALDLAAFERLAARGRAALAGGRPDDAARELADALALWRGPALADLAADGILTWEAARLDELRLAATERQVEAELACGRHAEAVAELEQLVNDQPLREHVRGLFMLALYRSGRQADALAAYRAGRLALVEQLGIEPGPPLQELERRILAHDPTLDPAAGEGPAPEAAPCVLVCTLEPGAVPATVGLAATLAAEAVIAATVGRPADLDRALAALAGARGSARIAAFTSRSPGSDLARLAAEQEADLVLVDAPPDLLDDDGLQTLLREAPCDVGVAVPGHSGSGPVVVPFTGAEHDWAAVELAAWIARGRRAGLQLAGSSTGASGRDASRLLASASLAVQRALGMDATPLLVDPSAAALVEAAADAAAVVVGLPEHWRTDGLGPTRSALVDAAAVTTVLVRRGLRPGGLAPRSAETRYTWTIAGS